MHQSYAAGKWCSTPSPACACTAAGQRARAASNERARTPVARPSPLLPFSSPLSGRRARLAHRRFSASLCSVPSDRSTVLLRVSDRISPSISRPRNAAYILRFSTASPGSRHSRTQAAAWCAWISWKRSWGKPEHHRKIRPQKVRKQRKRQTRRVRIYLSNVISQEPPRVPVIYAEGFSLQGQPVGELMVRKFISETKRLSASLTTLDNHDFLWLRAQIDLLIEERAKTQNEMAEAGENTPLIPETRDGGPAAGGSSSLLQHG